MCSNPLLRLKRKKKKKTNKQKTTKETNPQFSFASPRKARNAITTTIHKMKLWWGLYMWSHVVSFPTSFSALEGQYSLSKPPLSFFHVDLINFPHLTIYILFKYHLRLIHFPHVFVANQNAYVQAIKLMFQSILTFTFANFQLFSFVNLTSFQQH